MRMYDIIRKKRDGGHLSAEEIRFFTEGLVNGSVPDYQAAALCMAIFFNGMDREEIADLTFAVRDSGERLDLSSVKGLRADKHSTGGVGDKTSLVVAPAAAALGIKVAKVSGRGLAHTGGTIDKLESIPGFCADLPEDVFIDCVNRVGVAIIGQTRDVAPADKKLYALRDVTATVDSLPLIVSSIMGKKLAADDDIIVLDVKCGSGSFNKTPQISREIAECMVDIGRKAGKKISALITDMDRPLGYAIGNALEVREAIDTMKGRGPEDFTELCRELTSAILYLAGKGSRSECSDIAAQCISDGRALAKFREMIAAQGGDPDVTEDYSLFGEAAYTYEVRAPKAGYIASVDAEGYGAASLILGAGRNTMKESIDHTAGIILSKKTGERVEAGTTIATLYSNRRESLESSAARLLAATAISDEKPAPRPLIIDRVE
ncbi:MAG: thymidine phosphorylase [Lachnospiraceae bacterium]|nr:thymidine phosphorylase [Lachnospiraceae bacterium]